MTWSQVHVKCASADADATLNLIKCQNLNNHWYKRRSWLLWCQTASASVTNSREENLINLIKMLRFVAILSLAASAFTAPQLGLGSSLGSGIGVGSSLGLGSRVGLARTLCTTQIQVQYEQQCVESFDEIVDTTYTEQCEDIITERCQSTSQQVN